MDFLFAIIGALAIAGGVIVWFNRDKVAQYINGGPIILEKPSLSSLVDKMHAAKNEALGLAAVLEKEISSVRTDLTAATSKLVPAAPAPAVKP